MTRRWDALSGASFTESQCLFGCYPGPLPGGIKTARGMHSIPSALSAATRRMARATAGAASTRAICFCRLTPRLRRQFPWGMCRGRRIKPERLSCTKIARSMRDFCSSGQFLCFDLVTPSCHGHAGDEIRAEHARILLIKAENKEILRLQLNRSGFLLRVRTDAIQRHSNHRKEPAMGLDMYAFTTREDIPPVDFPDPADTAKLFYWRKHPNLHGWMEVLYRAKGGKDEQFSLAPVRLVVSDLDALEKAVRKNALPETSGFFFGKSRPDEKNRDLEFICKARDAIVSGKAVFYTSWW